MNCNCSKNGKTELNSCIPVPGATSTSATYVIDLTHYFCGNRKMCISSGYPANANLTFKVLNVESVGNNVYNCNILCSGTCTYMPYKNGNNICCNSDCSCPRTENIWNIISIPLTAATIPTLTAGTVQCNPANVKDCCNICSALSLTTSLLVAQS